MKYFFSRIRYKLIELKIWAVHHFQKLVRGYSDKECWCLTASLSEWILPRLKHFRNNINSCPPNLGVPPLPPENYSNATGRFLTADEWGTILDKIIFAFEFALDDDGFLVKCYPEDYKWPVVENGMLVSKDDRKPDYKYYDECEAKYREGMQLFQLYFRHLWD